MTNETTTHTISITIAGRDYQCDAWPTTEEARDFADQVVAWAAALGDRLEAGKPATVQAVIGEQADRFRLHAQRARELAKAAEAYFLVVEDEDGDYSAANRALYDELAQAGHSEQSFEGRVWLSCFDYQAERHLQDRTQVQCGCGQHSSSGALRLPGDSKLEALG